MHRVFRFFLIFIFCGAGFAQELYFPDEQFSAFALSNYDSNGNGIFTMNEAQAVTHMDCRGQNIRDLTGLEYFTELVNLKAGNNPLEIFPELAATGLEVLEIRNSRLQSMPSFVALTALRQLRITYSLLWELPDLSMLTNMEFLDLHGNLIMFTPKIPLGLNEFYLTDNLMFKLDHQDILQTLGTSFWVWFNFLDEEACPIVANTAGVVQGSNFTFMRGFSAFPYNEERFAHMVLISNRGTDEYNIDCQPK